MTKRSTELKWSNGRRRRVASNRINASIQQVIRRAQLDIDPVASRALSRKLADDITTFLYGEFIDIYEAEASKHEQAPPLTTEDVIKIAMQHAMSE